MGLALPQTKTGRYSKYLPDRLLERYFEARDDKEMLHLHEEIALLDTRLADLLRRVDTGESGKAWGLIAKAWSEYHEAKEAGIPIRKQAAWAALGMAIELGNTDYAAWQEIQTLVEQRRKLAESERKRSIELKESITTSQALLLVTAVLASVKEHVDERAYNNIRADFERYIGTRAKPESVEVDG